MLFFFQAEDGIRDRLVTGVQTCALPISELDQEIQKAFGEMDLSDAADDLLDDGQPANKLPASIASLKERREQLDQVMANLKEMDAARQAKGTDPQKNPAQIPKTDTDARVLPNKEGGYAANFKIGRAHV